jgi:hypothetical protein
MSRIHRQTAQPRLSQQRQQLIRVSQDRDVLTLDRDDEVLLRARSPRWVYDPRAVKALDHVELALRVVSYLHGVLVSEDLAPGLSPGDQDD